MNVLQTLAELRFQEQKKKYPRVPAYALVKPKYSDRPANELTKAIINHIRLSGTGYAERVNSSGRRWNINGKNKWIPTTGQKGTSDISAPKQIDISGRKVGVKVAIGAKVGNDRQSQVQQDYQHQIQQAGVWTSSQRHLSNFWKNGTRYETITG